VADPKDHAGVFKVFEEVAPEVPTRVYDDTAARIAEDIALGESWIAIDEAGIIVGYALAGTHDGEFTLAYLGVSKSAREEKVSSTLISKLKEKGIPINADVRANNKSSMIERFEKMGFFRRNEDPSPFEKDRTKLRWEKSAKAP
jgi:ribosomal protein S18 acetylase RimI-like enzyme